MVNHQSNLSYKREDLCKLVKKQMSEKRFQHVLGVEKTAIELANKYGESPEKASVAALLHDYAKERSDDDFKKFIQENEMAPDLLNWGNEIWHGIVGATMVEKELGIHDEEILQAIRLHTTGAAKMTVLDKIIYVADYIEPGRHFPGVEIARELAFQSLDQAVAYETEHTLKYLINKKAPIYPKTIETYNQWVAK